MGEKTEKICLTIIRWGSFLILLIPFLNPEIYKETLFPYIFPKIVLFQIITGIIFAVWLFLIVEKKEYRVDFKNPLVLSLTIFTGILFLTMFTGVDASRSFWGIQERMTGVLTMIHFYFWFLVLSGCFKEWKDWKKFLWVSLFCSFLIGLYALGQKAGLDFLTSQVRRMSATLGNPIYLSVYAMMHFFLALFLFLREKKKILILLAIFNLFIVSLGASRGVLFSLVTSFLIFLISLLFFSFQKKIKIAIIFFLLIVLGSGLFLYNQRNAEWVRDAPFFVRRIAVTEIDTARTSAWKAAWEGFKERPVRGWGWENYNAIHNKYHNSHEYDKLRSTVWFDKSHNQVMDILSLTGIFGFLSYLSIFISLFYFLFKKERIVLGVMFVAYFLQNLFIFDTPAPLIVFFFSLGLVSFLTQKEKEHEKPKPLSSKGIVTFLVLLILTPLLIYEFSVFPFTRSKLTYEAATSDFERGFPLYQESLKGNSFTNPESRLRLLMSFREAEPSENHYLFLIDEFRKSVKEHPFDVRNYLELGKILNEVGFWEEAEEVLAKALELSPYREEIYYNLAKAKIGREKTEEAISILERAVNLNENISDSHWMLGLVYLINEQHEEGLESIEKSLSLGQRWRDDRENIIPIAQSYAKIGNYEKAIDVLEEALKIDSKNITALIYKVSFLLEEGRRNEAEKVLEEIKNIDENIYKNIKESI